MWYLYERGSVGFWQLVVTLWLGGGLGLVSVAMLHTPRLVVLQLASSRVFVSSSPCGSSEIKDTYTTYGILCEFRE